MMVRFLPGLAWLWLVASAPILTDVEFYLLPLAGLWVTGVGLAGLWLAFTVGFFPARNRLWWFSLPLALAVGICLAVTDYGFKLRLIASEPWLKAYANQIKAGPNGDREPGWVGFFYIAEASADEGAVFLYTTPDYLDLNRHGIAFVPGRKEPIPRMRLNPVYGPWYRFTWRF